MSVRVWFVPYGRALVERDGLLWLAPADMKGTEFESDAAANAAIAETMAGDPTWPWGDRLNYSFDDPRNRKRKAGAA